MIGIIYKITNRVNNKVYIGKTYGTLKRRLYEHFYESIQDRAKNRKLYRAIIKYGKDSFYIEELAK